MITIEYKSLESLIPYARNSRTHSDEQVAQIAASIREFGWTNPVLIDGNNGLIAGHGRVMAARKLGIQEIPTIQLAHLTEAQKRALVLADNQLALNSGWDLEMLKLELEDLKAEDFNLDLMGFDVDFIDGLLNEIEPTEGLMDEDAVPEIPEEPKTKLGDVWILGNHRLMCGDSTSIDAVEALMNGQKADMVFTDPPYGYKYESNHQDKHAMLLNDDVMLDFAPSAYAAMFENSSIFVCGSFQTISRWIDYVSQHFSYKNLIVWKKNNWSMGDLKGAFAGQHELIIFAHKGRVELLGKRDTDIWSFDRVPPDMHPTQKPVDLVEYAMSKVSIGCVLDLFGGSGSTLIACEKTNRHARLMELDPKYCDVIIKRWQDFTGQKAIHSETGESFDEVV